MSYKKTLRALLAAGLIASTTVLGIAGCGNASGGENVAGGTEAGENGYHLTDVSYRTITTGEDWGPAIGRVVLDFGMGIDASSVAKESFKVSSVRTCPDVDYMTYEISEPTPHVEERTVTNAYLSDEKGNPSETGNCVTLEMEIAPYLEAGSPYWFNVLSYHNEPVVTSYEVSLVTPLVAEDGQEITMETTDAEGYVENINVVADEFDTTGAYTYTYDEGNRSIDLTYASWFPQEGAEEGSTPLIIWLHGAGEGGVDPTIAIMGNKVVNLATEDVQQHFGETGAAVLAPQSPTMWMDSSGVLTGAQSLLNGTGKSFYTEALMSLITDFVAEHPEIDATRVYLGGCSNGGYMTINLLTEYPGAFAAAYPVCEPYSVEWLTEEKIETLAEVPMWLTASKTDTIVTLFEGYWDEEPPFYYHVLPNEDGEEVAIDDYSNALYNRLVKAGAEDVHFSLFENVSDTSGNYFNEDGTPYEYDGHWSWIYTLNNECVEEIDGKETSIFEWMSTKQGEGKFPELPLEKEVLPAISFYLIRHGETEYNVEGIVQGWCDSPLTENGINLAKQLGEGLADIDFVGAYSSDSPRAVDTAKYALNGRDVKLTTTEGLREMYFGEMEGMPNDELITEENVGYRFGVGFDDIGGETWEGLGARMYGALEAAAAEHPEGGNILISTHGMSVLGTLYTVVPYADGVEEQGEIDNCSVTILEWDNGVYTLKTLNDTSYLE